MAGINNDQDNIKVIGVNVEWSQQQTECITTVADSSGSLNSQFFENDTHYIWYDVASGGTDPAVSGKTGIEVDIATDDTAVTVASATVTAINAASASFIAGLQEDSSGNKVNMILQQKAHGAVTAFTDGSADTTFTFATERTGSSLSLGFLEGEVSPSLSEDLLDITTNQTGTQIVNSLRTGRNVEAISVTMLERDVAKLKAIVGAGGHTFTPSGGTEVVSWGSEDTKNFTSILNDSRGLRLHPNNLADTTRTEDLYLWRAYPNLNGLVFSGEAAATMTVEFIIRPDNLKETRARLFVLGDWQQNFIAQ